MVKNVMIGSYIYNDETVNFNFYTNLTMSEKIEFISGVTDVLIGESYLPVLRDMMFDYFVIKLFTDVNTPDIGEDDDVIEIIEEFLEETNIVDIVKANMDFGLIEELNYGIDKNIEYKTGIRKNDLNEALASLVNTLERKVNEIDLTGAMEMVSKFAGMTDDFTTENIVKAFTTTDEFKKNVAELEESKERRAKMIEEASNVISLADKK